MVLEHTHTQTLWFQVHCIFTPQIIGKRQKKLTKTLEVTVC